MWGANFLFLVRVGISIREGRVSGSPDLFLSPAHPVKVIMTFLAFLTLRVLSGACFGWPGSVLSSPTMFAECQVSKGAHRARRLFQNKHIGLYVLSVSGSCGMGGVDFSVAHSNRIRDCIYIYICRVVNAANYFPPLENCIRSAVQYIDSYILQNK